MKALSQKGYQVMPSATLAIDSMFKSMKASGIDVIGFGAGEPDFETPDQIIIPVLQCWIRRFKTEQSSLTACPRAMR